MASAKEETTQNGGEGAASLKAKRFQISEEGPPPTNESNRGQTWRGDPAETFSDWKIVVISKTPDEDETPQATYQVPYHVHKFLLTCGRRNSKYFAKLFQNSSSFQEGKSCTTELELDSLAATAFPALLDYLYEHDKPLQVETKTATALHYLGEYLDIHHLRWDALQFCKKNISFDNADIYYKHAMLFQNETILGILAKFLGENSLKIDESAHILQISSPDLWINALEHSPQSPETIMHISKLMAKFAQHNPGALDLETFQALSCLEITPQIDAHAALTLCALDDKAAKDSAEELSQLQERCSDSLAQNWESLVSPDDAMALLLKDRKAAFLVDLLLKSLRDALSKLSSTKLELENTKETLASTECDLSSTRSKLSARTRDLGLVNAELEKFKPLESRQVQWGDVAAVPDSLSLLNRTLASQKTQQFSVRNGFGERKCRYAFYHEG
ncbi:nervous system development [Seminavis robusta]|uniref:Nervous system development n=1 Tax=Seminavis robusta TaxID=568900 RepID=A0A9N8EZE5_9STRA|nr:nervous system development [Seminavis robusta]|eukprot:Sro2572_g331650.1 nervous system development (446) ;mRNA; f:11008-12345